MVLSSMKKLLFIAMVLPQVMLCIKPCDRCIHPAIKIVIINEANDGGVMDVSKIIKAFTVRSTAEKVGIAFISEKTPYFTIRPLFCSRYNVTVVWYYRLTRYIFITLNL